MCAPECTDARSGFTLIELLVVVAIVALLLAILAPGLQSARQKAIESVCGSTLRGMMVGIQGYMGEYHDYFPPYGQVIYKGPKPAISTRYAAVLNRGKYTGPTWCPNWGEGFPVGAPDKGGAIEDVKKAEHQKLFGYTYNLQVGNLIQDPATGDLMYYDPNSGGPTAALYQALPARMYSELRKPSEFALMGDGGRWHSWSVWFDPDGVGHAIGSFQSLHGRYLGWKVQGVGRPMTGPRERGNIMMADGHVESFPGLWDVERYVRRYYLWPHRDY